MRWSLYALMSLTLLGCSPAGEDGAPTPSAHHYLTIKSAEVGAVKPLLGVIAGPGPGPNSPAKDLTDSYQDIGVRYIRNNDYFDDRLDMELMFGCPGPTYPCWNCDPEDPYNYNFASSDAEFTLWMEGGFEPFFRLGGERQNGTRLHDYKGPRANEEDNWIKAAGKVVERYHSWNGPPGVLSYVDIWTEWPNKHFWDRTNEEFLEFWPKAFVYLKAKFPGLKIGGPGFHPMAGSEVAKGNGSSWPAKFLQRLYYLKVKPDWIGYHVFSNDPKTWQDAAAGYKDLFAGTGAFSGVPWAGTNFFEGVELIVDAYATSPVDADGGPLSEEELDAVYNLGKGAAISTGAWVVMQYEGVVRAYRYRGGDSISTPNPTSPEDWPGGPGLFYGDADCTPKPSAHAFRLWSRVVNEYPFLYETGVRSEGADGTELWFLIAANAAGETAILIANPGSQDTTWSSPYSGVVEVYQVDDNDDGRTPHTKTEAVISIPAGSVQLAILQP